MWRCALGCGVLPIGAFFSKDVLWFAFCFCAWWWLVRKSAGSFQGLHRGQTCGWSDPTFPSRRGDPKFPHWSTFKLQVAPTWKCSSRRWRVVTGAVVFLWVCLAFAHLGAVLWDHSGGRPVTPYPRESSGAAVIPGTPNVANNFCFGLENITWRGYLQKSSLSQWNGVNLNKHQEFVSPERRSNRPGANGFPPWLGFFEELHRKRLYITALL